MELNYRIEVAENKLAVMYMLKEIEKPVSFKGLLTSILDGRFMSYFDFQQVIAELEDQGLIDTITRENDVDYYLTDKGSTVLESLMSLVTPYSKKFTGHIVPELSVNRRVSERVTATYKPDDIDRYVVTLTVYEKNYVLIKLDFTVFSQKDAVELCERFEQNTTDISYEIVTSLLKPRENAEKDE